MGNAVKEKYKTVEIPTEDYRKIEKIADGRGVTVDQFTIIFFDGVIAGFKSMNEIRESS